MVKLIRRIIFALVLVGFSGLAYAEPPAQSGNVIRYEGGFTTWFYDADQDITAYFGFDPAVLCSGGGWVVTPSSIMEMWKSDGSRFHTHLAGQLPTFVYPGEPDCFVIATNDPIATGVTNFRRNDNDQWADVGPDRNNVNSWGVSANGTLFGFLTNEPMRFMLQFHGMWDGDDWDASFRSILKIRLN